MRFVSFSRGSAEKGSLEVTNVTGNDPSIALPPLRQWVTGTNSAQVTLGMWVKFSPPDASGCFQVTGFMPISISDALRAADSTSSNGIISEKSSKSSNPYS